MWGDFFFTSQSLYNQSIFNTFKMKLQTKV